MSDHPASKPTRKRRWTVRLLMLWIVAIAVLMALLRPWLRQVRQAVEEREHLIQFYKGTELIWSYETCVPPGIDRGRWLQGLGWVENAWRDIVFRTGSVEAHDLDKIVGWLETRSATATPVTAEGDLYVLLDRSAVAREVAGQPLTESVPWQSEMDRREIERCWYPGQPSQSLVADTLRRLGMSAQPPVIALSQAARNGEILDRLAALRALAHQGLIIKDGSQSTAVLIPALADPEDLVVIEALHGLRILGPAAAQAMPAIEAIVHEERDRSKRAQALLALAEMGSAASPAKQTLLDVVTDPANDEGVRTCAAVALAAIDLPVEKALALWTRLLRSDSRLRNVACEALEKLGPAAVEALPDLRAAAASAPDEWPRERLEKAIQAIESAQGQIADEQAAP